MAARSVASRAQAAAARAAAAEAIKSGEIASELAIESQVAAEEPSSIRAEDYVSRRLARVRAQLDRIDDLLAELSAVKPGQVDARKLNDLAAAQARLATQEQQLAGRPLPGSRRPGKERSPRSAAVDPLEPID
jgi:hypothetical protein